jgi:carboxyl-terminal processing protease
MKSGDVMYALKRNLRGLAIGSLLIFSACSDDDDAAAGNKYVNNWIYSNMELYYLWNDDLPASPGKSKDPDVFFNSLLSDEDRFSWIQENYIELLNSLQGVNKEAGYDFKLYISAPGSEVLIGQIMYIKEGSLVDTEGKDLQRGDVFTKINGKEMTLANINELVGETSENHTLTYSRNNIDKGVISLNTAEFAENPNFMSKVIEVGDNKIGYYVYNFFATGQTATGTEYNTQMNQIFNDFKTAGITDLVIDLRYNSGGAEGATINLASLIGKDIDNTKVFTRRNYNTELQNALLTDPNYGPDFLIKKFTTKSQNVGGMLNNGRVYILTSYRTASASELLINGLKPFMDVFLIGDVTVGKNVGSISIYEENDPKNTWGMQPIVVKSYNSLNQSDYSEGFQPNILDEDNRLQLSPIGDPDEALLSRAIDHITGGSGARMDEARVKKAENFASSADFKRGSYYLVIDDEKLKDVFKLNQ